MPEDESMEDRLRRMEEPSIEDKLYSSNYHDEKQEESKRLKILKGLIDWLNNYQRIAIGIAVAAGVAGLTYALSGKDKKINFTTPSGNYTIKIDKDAESAYYEACFWKEKMMQRRFTNIDLLYFLEEMDTNKDSRIDLNEAQTAANALRGTPTH